MKKLNNINQAKFKRLEFEDGRLIKEETGKCLNTGKKGQNSSRFEAKNK